ncbi:hypothetical protein TRVL_07709 [Trypanosoma vivax]|nr:hypothetical protein TRVL_07709 [Trypanosoma vivax]
MTQGSVAELEKELEALSEIRVFNDHVQTGVDRILGLMPRPDEERNPEEKVRLLTLRSRARLLLPVFSAEAERDCSAALKLCGDRADLWVLLSECLLRRNASREACSALDNALQADERNVKALCQYSQVLRSMSSDASLTPAERKQYIADSVIRAKTAVAACPTNADGWHSYGISLLSEALASGTNISGACKSLQAFQRAASLVPSDPDIRCNKSTVEGLLGNFGNAAVDLIAALEADSVRLKGTEKQLELFVTTLRHVQSRMECLKQSGGKPLRTLMAKLSKRTVGTTVKDVLEGKAPTPCTVVLGVLDVLGESSMEPLVTLAMDRNKEFVLLLFYGLRRGALKINNSIVTISAPPSVVTQVEHHVPAVPLLDTKELSMSCIQVYADTNSTLVNDAPISPHMQVQPRMSSRLFV